MTPKQERFVVEYCKDFNASEAAIRAGFTDKNASTLGYQLLQKPTVRAEIDRIRHEIMRDAQWDATKVLIRLGEMADADIADILDEKGNYRPIGEWPVLWRRMLQGCDVEETFERSTDGKEKSWDKTGQVVKIKFIDRLKNLELLGRHVNIQAFELPKVEQHIHLHVALEERLNQARLSLPTVSDDLTAEVVKLSTANGGDRRISKTDTSE